MVKENQITINISHKTIFFIVILLLSIEFLGKISGIIIGLFVSYLLVIAISPLVDYLESKKISRGFSSGVILLLMFTIVTGTVASLISPLISQTQILLDRLPGLIGQLSPYKIDISSFIPNVSGNAGNVIKFAVNTFSGVIVFITFVAVCFYILQDKPSWGRYLQSIFGNKANVYISILNQLEVKLGSWVRGTIFLMLIVGVLNYIGFILIGLPYAISLALIAGLLEVIPNVGPNIAGLLAAIVGFSISPTLGFLAIFVAIIVQQLENNLLVPKIMEKAIGIHPVIIIIALLIGFSIGGIALAILSLPLVLVIQVLISHSHYNKKTHSTSIE
jgi:predicted PurR-regulated permease PerM